MASTLRLALLALALLAPLAFADIGPAPPAPSVAVHLVRDGQPETSVANITYHCLGAETYGGGAVEPAARDFGCSGGTCTNDNWYYKFNRCYTFPEGHFSYELDGRTVTTGNVSFDRDYLFYSITIDAPTGAITARTASDAPVPPSCWPAYALPALLAGAALLSRR